MGHLSIEGVFTHFARADETDKQEAMRQMHRFTDFCDAMEASGVHGFLRHCSNSAGILELPMANMDMVRAGITIYGIYPSDEVSRDIPLAPVMELKSHVVYIKMIEPGTAISYGGTFVADTSDADRDDSGRLRRRLSEKPEQLRICPDPWEEGADPREGLYGPVHGRRDGY